MRIVVVGETGNVGTALLRALAEEPEVTSVLGVARRLPDRTAEPYRQSDWAAVDLAGEEDDVVERLTTLFRDADAVVHLAWLIQPNRERELLRTANVEGTRRVARSVVAAGVPHLVVASSVGVYSAVDDDAPRAEDWPAGGIATSHYSVDKAAQERVLDELERDHPEVVVARLRTALVFQGDAGAEVVRLFVGPFVPVGLLRHGRPPLLPLPAGLRLQAVHADDAADAYRRVLLRRAGGAFNVAAHDLLRGPDVARIVDHGRLVELPPAAVRTAVSLAYATHAVAADPGWVDMGMGVPVMDTSRAVSELGWQPRHTAAHSLEEVVRGMAEGRGLASAPLRPDPLRPAGDSTLPLRATDPGIPPRLDRELLGLYLADHVTGATAGLGRIERMVGDYTDLPLHPELVEIAEQIRGERELYLSLLGALGLPRRRHRQLLAGIAERLGRLKLNGRVVRRSPMSVVLETELMRSAVVGKVGGWQTLEEHARELGLDPAQFHELAESGQRQIATLDRLHEYARRRAFREPHDR
ncbi:NAD-dependent epimerase/dehydratase family protein [Isoptericola sp. NEAU-Y5]|uniref:NAD-dependent epimerase/dehydratase family protein n=1 Tax=Isoptericola luteus TaxID=2879484 RepID=A0ABS7ZG37_9MICO|nr:NAD-dependent epimerase/dehydratase family protein [Isoptericola sp. NEAU-Y5]MCA5893981.1 NAD-dependent epimerase/dehydratase family protein [Isoptericola sp. NEAU-Y5]